MRILNRKQFLALEGEHVYAKYRPQMTDHICIKICNTGENDWVYQDLSPDGTIDSSGSDESFDLFCKMEDSADFNCDMDYDCTNRDGFYDDDQLFAVLSSEDVKALIERLSRVVK